MRGATNTSRRGVRLALGLVILVAAPLVALACGSFGGTSSEPPCTSCEESGPPPAAADGGVAADGSPVEPCSAAASDLAGCLCASLGAVNPCTRGVPGPKSACKDPGIQRCEPAGGQNRWSTCTGGSTPDAEACHNDIDDNCDGVVDEACVCSDSVDACRSPGGMLYSAGAYTAFTVPASPKVGVPFDLYIVTKNLALDDVGIGVSEPAGSCLGAGLRKPCVSPGAGCAGWKVKFFRGVTAGKVGQLTIDFFGNNNPPCVNSKILTFKVNVSP